MDYGRAINTAIGCVMGSFLDNNSKRELIDTLRQTEEKLEKLEKENKMLSNLGGIIFKSGSNLLAEKTELIKLIERNQLAWNYSKDKECGMLPEVYLYNAYVLKKSR